MSSNKSIKSKTEQKPEVALCEYLGDKIRMKLESHTGREWTATGRLNQLDIEMVFSCGKFSKKVRWNVFDIRGPFDPDSINKTFESMIEHDFSVVIEAYKTSRKVTSES